jgi:hypothetical protein
MRCSTPSFRRREHCGRGVRPIGMVVGNARHSMGERHHRRCSISPAASRPRWSSAGREGRTLALNIVPLIFQGTSCTPGWFGVMPILGSAPARAGSGSLRRSLPATRTPHSAPCPSSAHPFPAAPHHVTAWQDSRDAFVRAVGRIETRAVHFRGNVMSVHRR